MPTLQLDLFTPSGCYPVEDWAAELRLQVIEHLAGVFGIEQSSEPLCPHCGGPVSFFVNPLHRILVGAICCRDPLCGWFEKIDREWLANA